MIIKLIIKFDKVVVGNNYSLKTILCFGKKICFVCNESHNVAIFSLNKKENLVTKEMKVKSINFTFFINAMK